MTLKSVGRKVAILAAFMLAVVAAVLVFAHVNRRAMVRNYFRLETAVIEHWPWSSGKWEARKWEVQKLVPPLIRAGILAPARVQIEPGMSLLLDPRDLVSVSILRSGEWQPEIWDSIAPSLSEGAVFLDVGAHIGYFSIRVAPKVGKSGRVLAFEPNPETLKILRDNVAANNAANIVVEPVACTDREQTLTFYASPSFNTGASSLSKENADLSGEEPPREYQVRGRPIDDVIRELGLTRVDAIKIDVEGAETYVLRGASATLKRFHPKIVVETVAHHLESMHSSVDEMVSVIKAAGYTRGRPITDTDWEWTVDPSPAPAKK